MMRSALPLLVLCASPAFADDLQKIDMTTVPVVLDQLAGGTYATRTVSSIDPFGSQVYFECSDCARPVDSLISIRADTDGEAFFFNAAPDAHVAGVQEYCETVAESCTATLQSAGNAKGYGYHAFWGGQHIMEHSYFADGLIFVVSVRTETEADSTANLAYLLDITTPYVTGETE